MLKNAAICVDYAKMAKSVKLLLVYQAIVRHLVFMRNFSLLIVLFFIIVGCSNSEKTGSDTTPIQKEYYLRGSFNKWGLDNPMLKSTRGYIAAITLPVGKHEFKIADTNWGETNLGGTNSKPIMLENAVNLVNLGQNLIFFIVVHSYVSFLYR